MRSRRIVSWSPDLRESSWKTYRQDVLKLSMSKSCPTSCTLVVFFNIFHLILRRDKIEFMCNIGQWTCIKLYFCSPITLFRSEMHIWFWGDFGRDFRLRESFWLFPLLHQNRLWLQLGPRRQRCVDCACNVIPALSLCNLWILTNLINRWRTHHWAPQTAFQMTGSPPPETSAPDNYCSICVSIKI